MSRPQRDAAGRTLTIGLWGLTVPVVLLVVAAVVVFVAAATSDSDAGGYAVLFALGFLGPAVLASPFPILGWSLRVRHPRGSAVVVLLGGLLLVLVAGPNAVGELVVSGPSPFAGAGLVGVLVAAVLVWSGWRSLVLLRPRA